MILTSNGRLLLNQSGDSGEQLQVNGTAKITGATTIGGGGSATSQLDVTSNSSANGITLRNRTGNDYAFFNWRSFDGTELLAESYIQRTAANTATLRHTINNGSGVANYLTIASTGAATFSSSVTAASGIITGNLTVDTNTLFVDASANMVGIGTVNPQVQLDVNGSINLASGFNLTWGGAYGANIPTIASVSGAGSYIAFYPAGSTSSERMRLDSTGLKVNDAIAIGTTPDTNNPFKILKNINATVGIKFENTNTSSLAFSAVQLGTDVSGGTKFTNLVYASSGVTASGVYNPDGTSLINNGNGGLNFLGNPIRMYTGGSNGVLRWDLVSDGFITHYSATAPTTSATDGYRQYSADVTAGNAAPHFRTENGAVIKLYQETTAVGNAIFNQGGGNAVLDDSTFAGYTLRQIVKALQNQGILA
jgi:hypothetical protein